MARLAPIITKEELALKLDKYLNVSEEDEEKGMEPFPYSLPEKVMNDISKVEFDFENYEYKEYGYSKYPVGYVILPSGIPVLFVNAGGDWEFPICFALYWDGSKIRGYFPTKGQAFNVKAKSAFGNDNEGDLEDEEAEALVNEAEIIADVNNRIQVR